MSTASNMVGGGGGGGGGANTKRSGVSGSGRSGALLRNSIMDEEETSRLSEGSLTSLEKEAVSEVYPPHITPGCRSKNQQSTSSYYEYTRHRQETS